MAESPAVTWNLGDLYGGVDDPKIGGDLDALEARAARFAGKYRGQVGALAPAEFGAALVEYEEIVKGTQFPGAYAQLLFSADTLPPAHGALVQQVQERDIAVSQHLLFFELELIAIPDDRFAELLADPTVASYRHYLEHKRVARPHRLSEPEERILMEKSITGQSAFVRLYDETLSGSKFPVTLRGETEELSVSEVRSRLYDPDREVRRTAAEGITAGLQDKARFYTFVTNTLAYDKAVDDRLLHYDHPEAARHLDDEVDTDTVHVMLDTVAAHFGTVARYYRLKREILGLDELAHYDIYAPVSDEAAQVSWEDARQMVIDSYARFSPEFGSMAERHFTERWVDAEARAGKRSGAFCASVAPEWHPYVLMSFLGKQRDVMTLAHELGHGIHSLLSAGQHLLEYHSSLAAAETASVFGEMLTFNALLGSTADPKEKLSLLTGKVEDVFATVFRQTAMYRFEQAVHGARRSQGELPTDQVSAFWQENLQAMFEDAVALGDGHRVWWMYIPHFIHTPFYVYAYAFGQLLVMALYARYQAEGDAFVPRYKEILRAGGSKRPAEIMGEAGIDIRERSFWEGGLRMIDDLVGQAEQVWQQVK